MRTRLLIAILIMGTLFMAVAYLIFSAMGLGH